ncbi:hypothetical protein GW17_00008807, partial [Ensete ventricosum]
AWGLGWCGDDATPVLYADFFVLDPAADGSSSFRREQADGACATPRLYRCRRGLAIAPKMSATAFSILAHKKRRPPPCAWRPPAILDGQQIAPRAGLGPGGFEVVDRRDWARLLSRVGLVHYAHRVRIGLVALCLDLEREREREREREEKVDGRRRRGSRDEGDDDQLFRERSEAAVRREALRPSHPVAAGSPHRLRRISRRRLRRRRRHVARISSFPSLSLSLAIAFGVMGLVTNYLGPSRAAKQR